MSEADRPEDVDMDVDGTDSDVTEPTGDTAEADRADATAAHDADRPPTPEEEEAAARTPLDPDVAASYEAAMERGAAVEGEGKID